MSDHTTTTMKMPLPLLLASGLSLSLLVSPPRAGAQATPAIEPALVYGFSVGIPDFQNGVILGPANDFFGLSRSGGALDRGALFMINDDDGAVATLASFGDDTDLRGHNPVGALAMIGSNFFGVTREGGAFGYGTIFRISTTGEGETLVEFSGKDGAAPGIFPVAGLTLAGDGNFYGVTAGIEAEDSRTDVVDFGSVFRFSPVTGRFETLLKFTGTGGATPGAKPDGPVLQLTDGSLVGTTRRGGKLDRGTIFRIATNGTVSSFPFTKFGGALPGGNPFGRLIETSDGSVYGIAAFRSTATFDSDFAGALWKLPPGGVPVVAIEFSQSPDFVSSAVGGLFSDGTDVAQVLFRSGGMNGRGGLYNLDLTSAPLLTRRAAFDGTNGVAIPLGTFLSGGLVKSGTNFYFTSLEKLYEVNMANTVGEFAVATPDDNTAEGSRPIDPVLFDASDNLYQRTRDGGANGAGTIVKRQGLMGPVSPLAPLPAELFDSSSQPLTIDGSGNLLLVDRFGGANSVGRVLQFDGSGLMTTRATFNNIDTVTSVVSPVFGLTPDASFTNFYGQAFAPQQTGPNLPVVYRLTGGTISRVGVIGANQDFSYGPLVPFGDNQHFLGVQRGVTNRFGRVFKIGIGGNVTTLTNFGTSATGSKDPVGPLFQEASGSFLVPAFALNSDDTGTIVRIAQTGAATKLGQAPASDFFESRVILAPLAQDAQGRVYGLINDFSNSDNFGVLYRTDATGKAQVIHRFRVGNDFTDVGFEAGAGLTVGPDGAIYGNTTHGGPRGGGAIFKIFPDPNATSTTLAPTNVLGNSATFSGQLMNNGHSVEYWFSFGTDSKNLDQETAHVFLSGFHGSQTFMEMVTGLKGHRTYSVQFNAKVGFGADAIVDGGDVLTFNTPNGGPVALDDTILVTAQTGGFSGEVLANDTEPDEDPLTIVSFNQPVSGYGTVAPDPLAPGKLIYTPTAAFFDPLIGGSRDSFTYTISDDQVPPLSATATVNVLSDLAIAGEYAGLLFDDPDAAASLREPALVPSPNQIAAGFAQLAVGKGRRFSGRFSIGSRSFSVKGALNTERGTAISADRGRFTGNVRTTPAGAEARITFNGRTLILRAGQAFAAVPGAPPRPASDFTMRFDPTEVADPAAGPGLPAGSGYALVRQGSSARATLVGALPDGSKFSAKSVIDPDGKLPFLARINKGKAGTFDGELIVDIAAGTVEPAPGTSARWEKPALTKAKRFPGGFGTKLTPFGGKHTVPAKNTPALDLAGGQLVATFDRGGVFAPLESRFTFDGAKAVVVAGSDDAFATAKLDGRTGVVTGTFEPAGKPVKYRGVVVQRDKTVAGFFLGTADAGSVEMVVAP